MIQGIALTAQKLSDYKWENRILILSDNNPDYNDARTALKIIESSAKDLNDRDIIIFLLKEGKLFDINEKQVKIENSDIIPKYFSGYLLIGKDGGVKAKNPYPLELKDLFSLIDGMPMRRAEMKPSN